MRVMVALSGGVDSAVSALLLLEQGLEVEALFMKNWEEDDAGGCSAEADLADAEAVCARLGIRLHTRNFSAEYWDGVFEHFLAEHRAGRTPNPDILCNREIKFRVLFEHAAELGATHVATGHYARTGMRDGVPRLLRAADADKDQTYFLHAIDREPLARTLFPVGELRKAEVRERAAAAGFSVAEKKDSTGICFIGERRFGEFLARYLPPDPGAIRTPAGEVLGEHRGLAFYTLGQRQGLGIGGRPGSEGGAWYVVGKDRNTNTLLVDQGADSPFLLRRELTARGITTISREALVPGRYCAKIRYRQRDEPCTVETLDAARCRVTFDRPQRAATPGQSIVFYRGDECLGGAVIEDFPTVLPPVESA